MSYKEVKIVKNGSYNVTVVESRGCEQADQKFWGASFSTLKKAKAFIDRQIANEGAKIVDGCIVK